MQYNPIVYLIEFVERAEQSRPTSCGFGRVRHLSHRQIRFIIAFLGPYTCLCSHCHIQKAPAPSVVCRHVTRAFLLCSRGEGRRLDCCQCGCESDRGALKPLKCLNSLSTNMVWKCSGMCVVMQCPCRKSVVMCVTYCHKSQVLNCQNRRMESFVMIWRFRFLQRSNWNDAIVKIVVR